MTGNPYNANDPAIWGADYDEYVTLCRLWKSAPIPYEEFTEMRYS